MFQKSDSGLYECQISSTPVLSHILHLAVTEPVTEILGGPDIYVEEGATMNLSCVVRDSPEPPQFIFWYYNLYLILSYLISSYLILSYLILFYLISPDGASMLRVKHDG